MVLYFKLLYILSSVLLDVAGGINVFTVVCGSCLVVRCVGLPRVYHRP